MCYAQGPRYDGSAQLIGYAGDADDAGIISD